MKTVAGNHVGIVVNVNDPENRGRVQVYVPHVSTTLYNNWNEKLEDIEFKTFESSIFSADIKERLLSLLPWAEAAVPMWGGGTGAPVNTSTGTPTPFPTDQSFSVNADSETIKKGMFERAKNTPWSGGFISSIANSSGTNFPSNLGHAGYVDSIGSGKYEGWQKLSPSNTQPKVGDIVVGSRVGGSHGDVVTGVSSDGTLTVIGGNVGNTVSQYTKKISSNDYAIIRPTDQGVANKMALNATNEYKLWSSNGWNENSPDALGRLSQYYAMHPVLSYNSNQKPNEPVSGKVNPKEQVAADGLNRPDGLKNSTIVDQSIGNTSNMSDDFKAQYERVYSSLEGTRFANMKKEDIPTDGSKFGVSNGTREEWANLFTRMALVESDFTPNRQSGPSSGLYQLGASAWAAYGNNGNIKNPNDNTNAFVKYAESMYFGDGKFGQYGGTKRIAVENNSLPGGYGGIAAGFGPLQRAVNGDFKTNRESWLLAENKSNAEQQKADKNTINNIMRTTTQGIEAVGSFNAGRIGGPAGMFSCPAVGAKVWVFFQAENPQRPVYFANVYEPSNAAAAGTA